MTTSLKSKLTALFITIATILAACLVATSAAQASASGGCNPPGSTTIAQDAVGRFYSPSSGWGEWYVCAFKQGTPRNLGYTLGHKSSLEPPLPYDPSAKVSGRYVAFFVWGPGGGWLQVIDMVTGRTTLHEQVNFRFDDPSADQLVLKADGSVAWIAPMSRNSQPPVIWEVYRHDSTGTAILDSGGSIDPYSLATGGSWLYWTDAGSPRSAPFH